VTPLNALVRASGRVELVDESSAFEEELQADSAGTMASEAAKSPAATNRNTCRGEELEIIGLTLGVNMTGAGAATLTLRSPWRTRNVVMGAHLVIAEDDRAVRESVTRALELEGYTVTAVTDGVAALEAASAPDVDLLLLDLGMPNMDGLTVCRRLRSAGSRLPILVLTARTEVSDRVSGLDAGADDYLPKPFSLDELLARLRSLLRRSTFEDADAPATLTVEDLIIDEAARRAWRGERELELTKTEFDLLELLARNTGVVLSHSSIYDQIWGYDFGPDSKALAVYIGYLRRKTEDGGEPRMIQTVRGVGYTLRLS